MSNFLNTDEYLNFDEVLEFDKLSEYNKDDLLKYAAAGKFHLFIFSTKPNSVKDILDDLPQKMYISLTEDEAEYLYNNKSVEIAISLDRYMGLMPDNSDNSTIIKEQTVNPDTVLWMNQEEIGTFIQDITNPRPYKLKIANKAWNELFSHGIAISSDAKEYLSQMKIAKDWLRKNTEKPEKNHERFPLDQIASLICKNTSRTKIRKSINVETCENTPNHPLYASELAIANECWTELFSNNKNQNLKRGPKYIIEKWLDKKYPGLSLNAKDRISLAVNPRPQGGAPKS